MVVEQFKRLWLHFGVDFVSVRVLSADHCMFDTAADYITFLTDYSMEFTHPFLIRSLFPFVGPKGKLLTTIQSPLPSHKASPSGSRSSPKFRQNEIPHALYPSSSPTSPHESCNESTDGNDGREGVKGKSMDQRTSSRDGYMRTILSETGIIGIRAWDDEGRGNRRSVRDRGKGLRECGRHMIV